MVTADSLVIRLLGTLVMIPSMCCPDERPTIDGCSIADPEQLSPSQRQAFDQLIAALPAGNIFDVRCKPGSGRTTVLTALHGALGGARLTAKDFFSRVSTRHPLALEEAIYEIVLDALRDHDRVIVDDFHVATAVMRGACHFYPRNGLLEAPMTVLAAYACAAGKQLILGSDGHVPEAFSQRYYSFEIGKFTPEDYRHFCKLFLDERRSGGLDVAKVHRFAPNLSAHQIRAACMWFQGNQVDTEAFIDYLRTMRLASNVELGEVAQVSLRDLRGVDDVIRSLEANIVIPLEDGELAQELELQPKRGVLLAGPPGTGKTTVGRALAHRLKGKFFLIDGTFISGTQHFYQNISRVFHEAKENAPSIIFIDDSDVIFESGQEHGLYRYLLTMLDGLESKSAARVCVMMTAMDVGNLPPALIRSGRVELWLEMRLPDDSAHRSILGQLTTALPAALRGLELDRIAEATEGFTGADLKRVIDDGKALYAYDRATKQPLKPISDYFVAAVETVRANKELYAAAEARARANRPARPPWFDVFSGAMAQFGPDDLE